MTNTQNWKKTYEDYKVAALKPSTYDERYKNLKEKYERLSNVAESIVRSTIESLNTPSIRFTSRGIEFFFNGDSVWNSSIFHFGDFERAAQKSTKTLREVISCHLTKEIGCFTMNRAKSVYDILDPNPWKSSRDPHSVDFRFLAQLVFEAQEVLNNVDDNFREKLVEAIKTAETYRNQVHQFRVAKEHRERRPYDLKNQTIREWWSECGVEKGTELAVLKPSGRYDYTGVVDYTKQGKNGVLIYFTNGCKVHTNKIDVDRSFRYNNPVSENGKNKWGDIFDKENF